jgi:hypothetical protein
MTGAQMLLQVGMALGGIVVLERSSALCMCIVSASSRIINKFRSMLRFMMLCAHMANFL